jgi:wobble nucleotide-excising tRNase
MDIYKELVSTDDLIALLKSKDQVDQFLKERSIVINLDDGFIRTVLELQEGNEHCVICGAENRKEQVMRWKDVLDNEFQKQKNKYLSELQSLVSSIDRVWSIRESIESEVPNTLEFLRNLYIETLSIIERVKNNQFDIEVTILKPTLESISVEVSDLKNQLITFLVSNDADRLVGYSFQVQNIDNHVRKLKDELDELMATQAKSIVTEMNQIMQSMQIMRDIQVSVDRTGGNYKYKYTIDNQDIDVLSEGQRHKLALAFFLVSVKQLGLKNKTIVLDDPVVCLDELGYHVLKDIIINLRKQEETLRVIILTHNIFYLYIQLSNIFDNQSIRLQTSFFRMNSTEIREYSLDCLRIDDIALFKRALERVASEDELLIVSGIVNKIFRHFLDFLVRARGHLFNENPVDDIALLKVKVTQRKRLKQINRKISDIRKKGSGYDTKEAVELISLLQEALTILGFGDYIETSTITGLSRLIGSKNIKDELSGSDIYFDMIDAVNDVLYRNTFPELRGYLEHPRHQITKQITSISNDF